MTDGGIWTRDRGAYALLVKADYRDLSVSSAKRGPSFARLEVLEAGVRQYSIDIRHLQGDVREVAGKVDALARREALRG